MTEYVETATRDCGKCSYCDPAPSDITHFHRWAPNQCEHPITVTVENEVFNLTYLEEIEARFNVATAGPWLDKNCGNDCCVWITSGEDPEGQLAGIDSIANAEFMAHARTDVPALIALARQQNAKLMAIRQLVEESIHRISIEELRDALDATSES